MRSNQLVQVSGPGGDWSRIMPVLDSGSNGATTNLNGSHLSYYAGGGGGGGRPNGSQVSLTAGTGGTGGGGATLWS